MHNARTNVAKKSPHLQPQSYHKVRQKGDYCFFMALKLAAPARCKLIYTLNLPLNSLELWGRPQCQEGNLI